MSPSWVEPAGGGCEFYIPLDAAQRGRSQRIMDDAIRRLENPDTEEA